MNSSNQSNQSKQSSLNGAQVNASIMQHGWAPGDSGWAPGLSQKPGGWGPGDSGWAPGSKGGGVANPWPTPGVPAYPLQPGVGPMAPWPLSPWEKAEKDRQEYEKIQWHKQKMAEEADRKRSIDSISMEMIRRFDSAGIEKLGEECARGVESSEGSLGARHWLRKALACGAPSAVLRCWAAVCERGFDKEVLGTGKSETLMTAALGERSGAAVAWLRQEGFAPGRKLASFALMAVLSGSKRDPACIEALVKGFGAGTFDVEALALLSRMGLELESSARANAEAYEIDGELPQSEAGPSHGAKRL